MIGEPRDTWRDGKQRKTSLGRDYLCSALESILCFEKGKDMVPERPRCDDRVWTRNEKLGSAQLITS